MTTEHAPKQSTDTKANQPEAKSEDQAFQVETTDSLDLSHANIMRLQRTIGNRAVQRLLSQRKPESAGAAQAVQIKAPAVKVSAQPSTDSVVIQRAVEIDGTSITTYADAATWYVPRLLRLLGQQTEMKSDQVPAPVSVQEAIDTGKANADICRAGGTTEIDEVTADQAKEWSKAYIKANNEAEAEKAKVSAKRMKEADEEAQAVQDHIDNVLIPQLRDAQRGSFRKAEENALLALADSIATAVDTSLVLKDTVLAARAEAAELENMANVAKGYTGIVPSANSRAPMVLECVEKVNKAYASFQLLRAAIDLLSGKKTASGKGAAGVKAMSTVVGAGGTLLGASAGMTLYANLYISPMVDACLTLISKIEDMLSRSTNRDYIQMGDFNAVNWSIEPGGRAVFDFLLGVMHAEDASGVPMPVPKTVASYFVDNEDSLNAGVGGKKNDLPTTGFWFWEDLDEKKIAKWVFKNRANLWAMFYGDCTVPSAS